jgi:uncharacterized protein
MNTSYAIGGYRSAAETNSAMGRVYNHMAMAVITSMIVAALVASSPAAMAFLFTGFVKWVVIFAPLVAVFVISFALHNDPPKPIAMLMLHGFAALMGLSFATIFVVYTLGSIVSAFMAAAVLFAVMSFYGYFTRQSLDSWGKWLFVGLIAVIIASVINLFIGSTLAQMAISAVAIVVFLGLTAWDTQRLRNELSVDISDAAEVRGALSLYINFINIFLSLLQLFGNRDD